MIGADTDAAAVGVIALHAAAGVDTDAVGVAVIAA
jgi:hypothetical protein